nr:glycosyltransferase family 2 protein [Methylocystis silviterrae]
MRRPSIPKVSVIIPLYQSERFICDTLRSVQAQTFTDFEIVVVNDGSSDGGPALAEEFGEPRLRVVHQENRGLAGARNGGIAHAKGEYLAFLDADDLWLPTKLQRHVEHLDSDPQIGVSFSASALMDDDAKDIGLVQKPIGSTFDAVSVFCRNPVGNGSAPVIRRETLDAIAFFDKERGRNCWFDESFRQSEDIECWTRIAATTDWKFGYVDAPLTRYRVNLQGLSANVEAQLATWRRFRRKVASYAPALEAGAGNLAEAYQLRYLARRAIRSSRYAQGLTLVWEALMLEPRILLVEPTRTLTTLTAGIVGVILPRALVERMARVAMSCAASMRV